MNLSKIYSQSGIFLFFIIIFLVPIFWLIWPGDNSSRSLIEGRTLNNFPSPTFLDIKNDTNRFLQRETKEANEIEIFSEQILKGEFQKEIEKASSDQFPFRMDAIHFSKGVDRLLIKMAYSFFPDEAIPADMKSGLYIMRDKSMLIEGISRYSTNSQNNIKKRIDNYQDIITNYPDINFYLVYFERLSNSQFHPLSNYVWNADNRRAFSYFKENIPENLSMGEILLSDIEDHNKFFYRTDHHWNIHGALKAYDLAYNLMKENYSEMSAPIPHEKFVTFDSLVFLGSSARESYYPMISEEFEVVEMNLPVFTIREAGEVIDYNKSDEYLSGNYSREPFISHYSQFYGFDKPLLEYQFENNSQRNLLFISSSFANSIEAMIASHYKNTYVIDLRYFDDFSFSEFIVDKNIQDVLILGDNTVAFQSLTWIIDP